jgi:hypothetical protein
VDSCASGLESVADFYENSSDPSRFVKARDFFRISILNSKMLLFVV